MREECSVKHVGSVYSVRMSSKKRVNITIDSDVFEEMNNFRKVTGMDFSSFVEQMTVRFLGEMRPFVRRMEAAKETGEAISPSEFRVMLLQVMGGVQVQAGVELSNVLKELDIVEAEQKAKSQPKLLEIESIHTPKVVKKTRSKK